MFGQSDPYHIRQLFTVDARYVGVKGNIKMKLILENFKKFINEEGVNEIFGLFGKKSSVRSPDEDSGIPNPRRAGTNYTYGDIALTWSEITCSKDAPKCEELGLYDIDLEPLMQVWANEGSPMPSEEELMYGGQVPVKVKDLKENKKMKITKARLRQMIKEEVDAMRGADRPGAGIEDIAQPEGEEPIDVLMDVKARLAGMSEEELMQLAADLDGDMVTALRHILSDRMY